MAKSTCRNCKHCRNEMGEYYLCDLKKDKNDSISVCIVSKDETCDKWEHCDNNVPQDKGSADSDLTENDTESDIEIILVPKCPSFREMQSLRGAAQRECLLFEEEVRFFEWCEAFLDGEKNCYDKENQGIVRDSLFRIQTHLKDLMAVTLKRRRRVRDDYRKAKSEDSAARSAEFLKGGL